MQKILLYSGIGFALIVVIIVVVTLTTRNNGKITQTTNSGKIELTIWDPIDRPEIFGRIIEKFEEKNPEVKINYVFKEPLNKYEMESVNAISAEKGPDIWLINNAFIDRHIDKLEPAPDNMFSQSKKEIISNADYLKKRYVPIVAKENMKDDKLYGLPLYVDTLVMFSNPTLLRTRLNELKKEDATVNQALFEPGPSNWSEVLELTKEYTERQGDEITLSAIAMGRADNVELSQDILAALMLQNGTQIADAEGTTASFHLPALTNTNERFYPGTKALEFYTDFSNKQKENFTWDSSFPNSYEAFRDGKVALMFNYSDVASSLRQEAPNLNSRILPFPQIKGAEKAVDFADYWTFTVPKIGKNKQAAWSFIRYLSTTGLSTYLAQSGRPSPLLPSTFPKSVTERINLRSPYRYQTQTAQSWYHGQDPGEIEVIFIKMIDQVVDQQVKVQSAIDAGANEANEIFRNGLSTTEKKDS